MLSSEIKEENNRSKQIITRDLNKLSHMELDKKASAFMNTIENLKNTALQKLDNIAKKKIYTDLRIIEEQKKREELERLLEKR